jgi:hypothetical protein
MGVGGNLFVTNGTTTNNLNINTQVNANAATAFFGSIQTQGALSVGGNFIINGTTVYNTNTFTLSAASNNQISYFNVYRNTSNASIRWNEPSKYWDMLDVNNGNYYRIHTDEFLTSSLTDTTTSNIASASAANSLYTMLTANVTSLQSQITSNTTSLQNQISSNTSSLQNQITSNVNSINSNVSAVQTYSSAGYARANTSSNTFVGTTGSASPSSGSITFTSTNGVTVVGSGNTITISDPQDLRTTASPTFSSLTLSTTPLAISSGGTGSSSSGAALTTLLPTGTTSGYVLTTGGPGNFYWAASGAGGGATPGTTINSTYLAYTGNGAGVTYTTPTYIPGADQLKVYLNGVRQHPGTYTETSNTTMSFSTSPASGTAVLLEIDGYIVNPYYANNIAYTVNSKIGATANTIQLAIDGLAGGVAYANGYNWSGFTGVVTAPTMPTGTANTTLATTAYVSNFVNNSYTLNSSISGNAGTVTNGLYSSGSYSNPSWLTSISGSIVSGNISGNAANITGTYGGSLTSGQVTTALGFTPYNSSNPSGYISGITSSMVTSALGYTPYNSSNPSGYITSSASITGTATNITAYTINQSVGTGNNVQFNTIGVGTSPDTANTGSIRATNNITAYYSDERLKTKLGPIENAVDKVLSLNGFYHQANEIAQALGYDVIREVGLSAQQVQKVMPEVVAPAPIDDKYLTVRYERLVPLLVEAIKELKQEIEELKANK